MPGTKFYKNQEKIRRRVYRGGRSGNTCRPRPFYNDEY